MHVQQAGGVEMLVLPRKRQERIVMEVSKQQSLLSERMRLKPNRQATSYRTTSCRTNVLPNRSLSVQARTTPYGCPPIPAAFGQHGVAANMKPLIASGTDANRTSDLVLLRGLNVVLSERSVVFRWGNLAGGNAAGGFGSLAGRQITRLRNPVVALDAPRRP
jgi:hypothetical protein